MASIVAAWPTVALGEVVRPVERPEIPVIGKLYRQVGVKLWGQGAYERESIDGGMTQYKTLSRVEANDIIVNKIWARNGSVSIVTPELAGCYVSGEFPTFAPLADRLLPQWFGWLTKTRPFWEQCDEKSRGTSGKNRIRPEKFLEIEIPLPPLDEQRRIVARIEALAARIEQARGLRRKALAEASQILQRVISRLPFDETEWTNVRSTIAPRKGAVRTGPFGSQLHHEAFVEAGIAAIGTRDVQVNCFALKSGWYVTPEKFQEVKRYQVYPGDVLATIVGASIGRFCVVPDDIPLAFTTKHILALSIDQARAEPDFMTYMLNYHVRSRRSLFAQVEGSAQPSLNSTKVLDTELPLPSLAVQVALVAHLNQVESMIDALTRSQLDTEAELDALLPSILDKAFRGEL